MHGPICEMCDRGNCDLDDEGWCLGCRDEFTRAMSFIKCTQGLCTTRVTCRRERQCVQLKASLEIVKNT